MNTATNPSEVVAFKHVSWNTEVKSTSTMAPISECQHKNKIESNATGTRKKIPLSIFHPIFPRIQYSGVLPEGRVYVSRNPRRKQCPAVIRMEDLAERS